MTKESDKYLLEERTAVFGESIVELCKGMKRDAIGTVLIKQVIRSGTSIGANYSEANNASSRRDFRNKIYIAKKETQETIYWLRMLKKDIDNNHQKIDLIRQECMELLLIFQKITSTIDKKDRSKLKTNRLKTDN